MLFKSGCVFCGGKESLKMVSQEHCYSTRRYYYHDECLKTVLAKPEVAGHAAVDTAIEIERCIHDENEKNRRRLDAANKALSRLGATDVSGV
jgi:hypothetical protein